MSLKSSLFDVFEQDVTLLFASALASWLRKALWATYAKPDNVLSPTLCIFVLCPDAVFSPRSIFGSLVNIFSQFWAPERGEKSWSSQSLTILSFWSDLTQPFTQYGSSAGRLEPWSARSPTWSLNPSTWSSGGRWYEIENKRKIMEKHKRQLSQNLSLIISQPTSRLDGCKGPWVFSIVSFSINNEISKWFNIYLKMLT